MATDLHFGQWVEACGFTLLRAGPSEAEMVTATAPCPLRIGRSESATFVWVPAFARDVLES